MKLPRTIRLDPSDARVFAAAAEPGEWAVAGTFVFVDGTPADMDTKTQLAFCTGWLGIDGFGFSTFVQVTVAPESEVRAATTRLAQQLFERYGAPDMLAAMDAARGEIEHAASLCDHPAGTLLAIQRDMTDDGIAERVRIVPRPDEDGGHARIWSFVKDENESGTE